MKILIFGATGFCGRAFVQQAVLAKMEEKVKEVTIYVRDKERAQSIFSSQELNLITIVVGSVEKRSYNSAFSQTVRNADVIINCLSSYRSPNNQMSTQIEHIIAAKLPKCVRFVHFGYPRGLNPESTRLEKIFLELTRTFSIFKIGPAVRDHKKVLTILQKNEEAITKTRMTKNIEYTIFCVPKKLTSLPSKKTSYYGTPGSVERALRESRLWHSISTIDAAELVLTHVLHKDPLPSKLALSYA